MKIVIKDYLIQDIHIGINTFFGITPHNKRFQLLDLKFVYKLIYNHINCPKLRGSLNFKIT